MAANGTVENDKQVKEYKESVFTKAEKLVKVTFPSHIVELNQQLEDPIFKFEDMTKIHSDIKIPIPEEVVCQSNGPNTKKRKVDASEVEGSPVYAIPGGEVPINDVVVSYVDRVKPRLRTLVDEANCLKMWVAFLIPKIEDGNNFGVGIQEETLEEIRGVESDASSFYEAIARYFLNRAKILTKVAKYPHIADYRRAVSELDEKQLLSLKVTLVEMRNHYAALHDMIVKNWEKIKTPRSANNHSAMY